MIAPAAVTRAILAGTLAPAKPRVWVTLCAVSALAAAGKAATTYAAIARVTGQSASTIRRALREAEALGLTIDKGY